MAKILVIEDSRPLLALTKKQLAGGGHHVLTSSSGAAAIRRLKRTQVDLVLTDLYMPQPDGFEIVSKLRALRPQVPLVVMSADSLACDVFGAGEALGVTAALAKPFSTEKLLATINGVLAAKAAESCRPDDPRAAGASPSGTSKSELIPSP